MITSNYQINALCLAMGPIAIVGLACVCMFLERPSNAGPLLHLTDIRGGCATCTDQCTEGWINLKDFIGGIECAHGPQYDKDCPEEDGTSGWAMKNCYEITKKDIDPPKPVDADHDNRCYCFKCFPDKGCEKVFRYYVAYCGVDKSGECAVEKDVDGGELKSIRTVASATIQGGAACAGQTDGMHEKEFCGGEPWHTQVYGCVTNNCQGGLDFEVVEKGFRYKCK